MKEVLNMKKNYMAPEAEFLGLVTEDILILSKDPMDDEAEPAYGSEAII